MTPFPMAPPNCGNEHGTWRRSVDEPCFEPCGPQGHEHSPHEWSGKRILRAHLLEGDGPRQVVRVTGREERIANLAAVQHGVVTRGQLLEIGMSAAAIGCPLRAGRLRALHAWEMLRSDPPRPVHISVPANRGPSTAGAVFDRVTALTDDEWTVLDGIRITTPARTSPCPRRSNGASSS